MAKAVTLKNSSNEEVYPVTDISLVNGGIYADTLSTLEPTTGYISTAMLQDEAVTAPKLGSELSASIGSYSTTEVATPFTWIDGNTIYKKTVSNTFSTIPAGGVAFNHGISNFSKLIKTDVVFNLGWDTTMWGDGSYLARNSLGVRISPTQVCLDRDTSSNWSGTIYVTIYYTKSS